jgi:hypothetical protein
VDAEPPDALAVVADVERSVGVEVADEDPLDPLAEVFADAACS